MSDMNGGSNKVPILIGAVVALTGASIYSFVQISDLKTQLAETLGISRLSLREATKALEFLGIVESKTGVGLTVGRIDMGRVTEHLGFHTGLLGQCQCFAVRFRRSL